MESQPVKPEREEDITDYARRVLCIEAEAISQVAGHLDTSFREAVAVFVDCRGRVVVTGVGKAGIVGQKVSATLASTGTPSHWMHPCDARHGDLGRVVKDDVILALSNSGETDEMLLLLPAVKRIGATIIAITCSRDSTLGKYADIVLEMGPIQEACPLGLAPSASTTAMLALGDALSLCVLRKRDFTKDEYALYHPAGELGRRLLTVEMVMRTEESNPVTSESTVVREVLRVMTETVGSPGAALLVDQDGKLSGIITDGDIRRLLQQDSDFVDRPVSEIMTQSPKCINSKDLASEALRICRDHKIDQLPVIDDDALPAGIIDVQDLMDVGKI